ncbi:YafY family protein [Nocardioides sp. CFH 31398]|uniref:helix-turn-helix transcriptional regulator n=1 Tax=Nocardioides sp. CFH 31398 TaxID=2919579 RepID=UPI001F064D97|nr:transcriptional regulator [Nocardioides sp. CFH 31398]MCH1866118.1 transcriptional regulator [Nocardioides sp. CFH 31398]
MSTSARMLRLLSLLQTHRYWPGGELSERLEVSPRTVRRDVERLRDLGYDVDAVRGVAGGYQLRAGSGSMPPLLLEDEEAVAIAVGLRTSAAGAVRGLEETSVQALTKVVAMMPPRLRRRLDALDAATDPAPGPGNGPVLDAGVLTTLAQAARDGECLRFGYTARGAEGPGERRAEPHRLVTLGRRWYLVAWDRDRRDWRSFRLDRISDPAPTGMRFTARELPAEDATTFVRQGISRMPTRYVVRARVAAPAADVRRMVWGEADVEPLGEDECRLVIGSDWPAWPAMLLAALDADYVVEDAGDLAPVLQRTAARMASATSA